MRWVVSWSCLGRVAGPGDRIVALCRVLARSYRGLCCDTTQWPSLCSPVTIQRLYRDTLTSHQAFACHDTTCCIVTHSQAKLPPVTIQFVVSRHGPLACLVFAPVTIQSLHRDTPHPGCPYCDTTTAPAKIQSLYCDRAFPPG